MRGRSEPQPLGDLLAGILRRIGVGDLEAWNRLQAEWPEVAPNPWDRHARPLSLSDGTLVVEAVTPAAVSLLKYGVASLQAAIEAEYGPDLVREIRVRSPGGDRRR